MSDQNYTSIDDLVAKHKEPKDAISLPKEAEPFSRSVESIQMPEVSEMEKSQEMDKDVEKFVEVKQDSPEIPEELEKAGVQPAAGDMAAPSVIQSVKLPIPDDKVLEGLDQPLDSSWRWMAESAMWLLKRAHIGLKKVHGHVVRFMTK